MSCLCHPLIQTKDLRNKIAMKFFSSEIKILRIVLSLSKLRINAKTNIYFKFTTQWVSAFCDKNF